jgi:hypothetical protein
VAGGVFFNPDHAHDLSIGRRGLEDQEQEQEQEQEKADKATLVEGA